MKRILGLIAVAGMFATAAQAQVNSFVLNDGLFRYSVGTTNGGATARTGTGGGSGANFGLASGLPTATTVTGDYLFQNHFWYRSAGDTREFALSNMTFSTALGGNSIFTRYVEPIGGSSTVGTLNFELTYTLNQITPTTAALTINWSIVNNSNSTQPVSFFSYADSDIGSAGNDSGSYASGSGVNVYRNDDVVSPGNGSFFTMAADLRVNDNWNIGPFSGTGSPRGLLTDSALNNLTNIDTVLGAADNAGAMQWQDLSIGAGGTVGGRITFGYNYVVPTPGAAALLGLGGLVALRRRR